MEQEKRLFKRLERQIIFLVEGEDSDGRSFMEKATALNLSGGGALFITTCVDNYFMDQVLDVRVVLPETPEVRGVLNATAKVVRLSKTTEDVTLSNGEKHRIGICFQKHLKLIRLNS